MPALADAGVRCRVYGTHQHHLTGAEAHTIRRSANLINLSVEFLLPGYALARCARVPAAGRWMSSRPRTAPRYRTGALQQRQPCPRASPSCASSSSLIQSPRWPTLVGHHDGIKCMRLTPTVEAAGALCWFSVAAGLPAVDPSVVTRARSADDYSAVLMTCSAASAA